MPAVLRKNRNKDVAPYRIYCLVNLVSAKGEEAARPYSTPAEQLVSSSIPCACAFSTRKSLLHRVRTSQ